MQIWQIIILLFGGLSVFNSLALIIYLQISPRKESAANLFIQVIFIAFIVQVLHAFLELFQWQYAPQIGNLYLLGVYSQGPSMFLMIKKTLDPNWKIWPKHLLIHYLPWVVIGVLPYNFDMPGTKEWLAIYLVGFQFLFYILSCIQPYRQLVKRYRQGERRYFLISYLFPAFAFLWITYPFAGITKINYQIIEIILHSAFLYYLVILKIKEPRIGVDKYEFSGINKDESLQMFQKTSQAIIEKELFLDPNITLRSLSSQVHIPGNILSQVINQNAQLNFRDYINHFRVEKSKSLLIENTSKGFTIASVAFDCGFNSLSVFNRAFRKVTGTTPSAYIKANSRS